MATNSNAGRYRDRNPDMNAFGASYKIDRDQLAQSMKDDPRPETPKEMQMYRTVKEPGKRTPHVFDPAVSAEKRLGKASNVCDKAGDLLKDYVNEEQNPITSSSSSTTLGKTSTMSLTRGAASSMSLPRHTSTVTASPAPLAGYGKPSARNAGADECFKQSLSPSSSDHELPPGTQRRRDYKTGHFNPNTEFGKPSHVDTSAIKSTFRWESQDEPEKPKKPVDERVFGATKPVLNRETTNSLMHMGYTPSTDEAQQKTVPATTFGKPSAPGKIVPDGSITKKDNVSLGALVSPSKLVSRGIHPGEMDKGRSKKELRSIIEGVHGSFSDKDFDRVWNTAAKGGDLVSITAFQAALGQ